MSHAGAVGAELARLSGNLEDSSRHIGCIGGAPIPVVDDTDSIPLVSNSEHRPHEILPERSVNPRRSEDDVARIFLRDGNFTLQFGLAVDAPGIRPVIFHIGTHLRPIEYVIG